VTLTLLFAALVAVPLFFGAWRLALLSLAAQALALAALHAEAVAHPDAATTTALVDLVALRAVATPLFLAAIVRSAEPARFEALPANLLHWTVALILTLLAASFADRMTPAGDVGAAVHLGVVVTELLLGLLILCCQSSTLGQIVGALTIENAVLLFETRAHARLPLVVQLGVAAVFVGFVLLAGGFLRRSLRPAAAADDPAEEGELL
jgi:hydrogenase-4 membrane subunit HyfE